MTDKCRILWDTMRYCRMLKSLFPAWRFLLWLRAAEAKSTKIFHRPGSAYYGILTATPPVWAAKERNLCTDPNFLFTYLQEPCFHWTTLSCPRIFSLSVLFDDSVNWQDHVASVICEWMRIERWLSDAEVGILKHSEKTLSLPSNIFSTRPTWIDPETNTGRQCDRSATAWAMARPPSAVVKYYLRNKIFYS
jgi:hypothetical protein